MKSTELFKETIKNYLDGRASKDFEFAQKYVNEKKSIDECIQFIFQEVQKSGCNGFADEEIYGMAVHYYDEENLGEIKNINAKVVVNHTVELTQEDIAEARRNAIEQLTKENIAQMTKQQSKKQEKQPETQLSLF